MTLFWILLFIICLSKIDSTGENPADHSYYTHDAPMISHLHDAHHFWRQGHQTFSGFIKARERPRKGKGSKRLKFTNEREKQGEKKRKQDMNGGRKTENTQKYNTHTHTQSRGEKKSIQTDKDCPCRCFYPCKNKKKKTQKSISTKAGIFILGSFIISKSTGKRKQIVGTGAKGKAEGKVSSRREAPQCCSHLCHLKKQVRPLFISLYSLKLFKLVWLQELCKGNLITFIQFMHARNCFTRASDLAQSGH
ncbi:hypothetical protein NC651_033475 [Populus alba x Populus x berolinensis]|nr:hypothetical protein NC651_033475 [Populus alba x Populus x berolinensis]